MQSLKRRIPASVRQRVRRFLMQGTATAEIPIVGSFHPGGELATIHHTRETIASVFLRGNGIEIGALHQPLKVPDGVQVRYVDRMPTAELKTHYPDLASLPLVEIDVIDNGETLGALADASEDFAIANHFLEHCQN